MFEQVQLTRSLFFARVSNDLNAMEAKVQRITDNFRQVVISLENQRRTITLQRNLIRTRAAQIRRGQESLERFRCDICFTRDKDTAFNCGHMFCNECAQNLASNRGPCPICREPITDVMKVNY